MGMRRTRWFDMVLSIPDEIPCGHPGDGHGDGAVHVIFLVCMPGYRMRATLRVCVSIL